MLKQDNTQNKALAETQGVIQYLQSQVVDLTAENDTLRRLQKQAIVDPLGNNETSKKIDHKLSPNPSASLTNIFTNTNKCCLKLTDPSIFTDGKDSGLVKY